MNRGRQFRMCGRRPRAGRRRSAWWSMCWGGRGRRIIAPLTPRRRSCCRKGRKASPAAGRLCCLLFWVCACHLVTHLGVGAGACWLFACLSVVSFCRARLREASEGKALVNSPLKPCAKQAVVPRALRERGKRCRQQVVAGRKREDAGEKCTLSSAPT